MIRIKAQFKLYVCFIFVLLSFSLIHSQGSIDKKLVKFSGSTKDTLKINSLLTKGANVFYGTPDSAYFYYKQALSLSIKNKNKKGEAHSLLGIGKYLNYIEKHKESLKYYLDAIGIFNKLNDELGIARSSSFT